MVRVSKPGLYMGLWYRRQSPSTPTYTVRSRRRKPAMLRSGWTTTANLLLGSFRRRRRGTRQKRLSLPESWVKFLGLAGGWTLLCCLFLKSATRIKTNSSWLNNLPLVLSRRCKIARLVVLASRAASGSCRWVLLWVAGRSRTCLENLGSLECTEIC